MAGENQRNLLGWDPILIICQVRTFHTYTVMRHLNSLTLAPDRIATGVTLPDFISACTTSFMALRRTERPFI